MSSFFSSSSLSSSTSKDSSSSSGFFASLKPVSTDMDLVFILLAAGLMKLPLCPGFFKPLLPDLALLQASASSVPTQPSILPLANPASVAHLGLKNFSLARVKVGFWCWLFSSLLLAQQAGFVPSHLNVQQNWMQCWMQPGFVSSP